MKLTTKGRYAVMAMADIALYKDNGPISLSDISFKLIGPTVLFEARSAIAITAYLPLVVSFINLRCITIVLR